MVRLERRSWTPKRFTYISIARFAYVSLTSLAALWLLWIQIEGKEPLVALLGQQGFKQKASDTTRICTQNPYRQALYENLETVAARADEWLSNTATQLQQAAQPSMQKHTHDRFFPFDPMATSLSKSCLGGNCRSDRSKIAFGIDQLKQKGCIVYSIGSNNFFEFEQDTLKNTPCEVHTFDCTGRKDRFRNIPDHERMHFHHVCLGDKFEIGPARCKGGENKCGDTWTLLEIQRNLKHTQIDLFKMDIEGFEWDLFHSWPELEDQANSEQLLLPMQLLVEVSGPSQIERGGGGF